MQHFDPARFGLPPSRAVQSLLVTLLYAVLAYLAMHAPIAAHAPLVRLLGTIDGVRESAVAFVRFLFWPLTGILLVNLVQDFAEQLRRARRPS
ncbi:MAG: hypothetical protein KIS79_14660 [Burkholderiales bacterium]|nr:hypothetical protein [Burkholderiales bacterium]